MNKVLVKCADCGKAYAARRQDGEPILPTNDGSCECGSDSFVELEASVETDLTESGAGT